MLRLKLDTLLRVGDAARVLWLVDDDRDVHAALDDVERQARPQGQGTRTW